ncbi:hypothetical protein ACFU8W_32845 [Streptomyces sp. NPDC057565]
MSNSAELESEVAAAAMRADKDQVCSGRAPDQHFAAVPSTAVECSRTVG